MCQNKAQSKIISFSTPYTKSVVLPPPNNFSYHFLSCYLSDRGRISNPEQHRLPDYTWPPNTLDSLLPIQLFQVGYVQAVECILLPAITVCISQYMTEHREITGKTNTYRLGTGCISDRLKISFRFAGDTQ